jgi:hypothetical protein
VSEFGEGDHVIRSGFPCPNGRHSNPNQA